jgi:hypothetical protein
VVEAVRHQETIKQGMVWAKCIYMKPHTPILYGRRGQAGSDSNQREERDRGSGYSSSWGWDDDA